MPNALRTAVMSMRTSGETKARLRALATQQGLTESALLALLVDKVLSANALKDEPDWAVGVADERCANDRLTLRLRPGDRALADARAAARRMKTSSYLAMLVRAHVREVSVMPPRELDELRSLAGHLASLGRQIRTLQGFVASRDEWRHDGDQLLIDVGTTVESVRDAVAGVVRTNLASWEVGNA